MINDGNDFVRDQKEPNVFIFLLIILLYSFLASHFYDGFVFRIVFYFQFQILNRLQFEEKTFDQPIIFKFFDLSLSNNTLSIYVFTSI